MRFRPRDEQQGASTRELWVLNPKAFPEFLKRESAALAQEDVQLASFHLSRKAVTNAVGPAEYFDVQTRDGQIILTPVRIQRADAVAWARRPVAAWASVHGAFVVYLLTPLFFIVPVTRRGVAQAK